MDNNNPHFQNAEALSSPQEPSIRAVSQNQNMTFGESQLISSTQVHVWLFVLTKYVQFQVISDLTLRRKMLH